MAIPYPYTTQSPLGINTGSYLNQNESDMFVGGFSGDIWYGFSENDVIEVSAFDMDQNPLGWATIHTDKQYKTVSLTYLNSLNQPVEYSYRELLGDFVLYRNSKILVNPIDQLSQSFGIVQGSYILSYNFTREMAGSPTDPLVIKDISPSRKEIKLTPLSGNNAHFEAFCRKKFLIKDVAPVLIQLTNQCPIAQNYNRLKGKYSQEIIFLKNLLFLDSDGAFVNFLKTLYEDVVTYTRPEDINIPPDQIRRVQGIRTYYQNFLLSNYEAVSEFMEIDNVYDSIVEFRVAQQFKPYGIQTGDDWVKAKQFLMNFFSDEFYHQITLSIKTAFDSKYYAYLKNALNFGNNKQYLILDIAFSDERTVDTDPLTLLVKLKNALPEDVATQTECWVSNVSIAPFVVNAILRQKTGASTRKIGPPNFSVDTEEISLYNVNESFDAATLRQTVANEQAIEINKRISELQVDYTDFSKFVIFSSAAQRLVNFKKKIATWYGLSSSLDRLNLAQSNSLAAGSLYPQYDIEKGTLEGQMTDVIKTFDGYESYLFKSGSYAYNPNTGRFVSASYVTTQDQEATQYDRTNRDSLINNTPEHIVLDSANDEYLTFLNMIGHYFDNLSLYISNIPSERVVNNDPTKTLTKQMVDYMLNTFGWKLGTTYEDLTQVDTYLTASSGMSAEDRTKAIRTRILSTLPQIYKTKGTEEAVTMLLACYGIPSNLLDIREYGNDTYDTASKVTYTRTERTCLFPVSASGDPSSPGSMAKVLYFIDFAPKPNIRTFEMKVAVNDPNVYNLHEKCEIATKYDGYDTRWDYKYSTHTNFGYNVSCYNYLGTYTPTFAPSYYSWRLGMVREYGNMGRIWAELATYSASIFKLGDDGIYSGSFEGRIIKADSIAIVTSDAGFTASYWSGSANGGVMFEKSGSITGSVVGIVSGSIFTTKPITLQGAISGAAGIFYNNTFSKTGEYFKDTTSPYNSRISFGRPKIYLTSSLLPLFDGDVFNIRLRRNEPNPAFQFTLDYQKVPCVYDLTVQRNESGRRIFRSICKQTGDWEANAVWDGISMQDAWEVTGSLGTTISASIDIGAYNRDRLHNFSFGNTMVWDVPISDADFEIHCNDFNSFTYSGSDPQKHLIVRMDTEEPYDNTDGGYAYALDYGSGSGYYTTGFVKASIPNRSEYYSTFDDRFSTVVASGSYRGPRTGSLRAQEYFLGRWSGSMSGSISGSGIGIFNNSTITGLFSGSLFTGSFNAIVSGTISSSTRIYNGYLEAYPFVGMLESNKDINGLATQSIFTGSFSGSASGSFWGECSGTISNSMGITYGVVKGAWGGILVGTLSGSFKGLEATGTFWGNASASRYTIPTFGNYIGTHQGLFFGSVNGIVSGSFTGSVNYTAWSGSSFFVHFYDGRSVGSPYYGQALYSGSHTGIMSSSIIQNGLCDFSWTQNTYATGTYDGWYLQPWTGSRIALINAPIGVSKIGYTVGDWYPLHATTSQVLYECNLTYSIFTNQYPYDFHVLNMDKTYTTPNFGPNRFHNEKVKEKLQSVDARLDDKDRSTTDFSYGYQSDSNLLGLFLDPQDAKNRDIVKFYGDKNITDMVADPSDLYSSSYSNLNVLNQEYNSFGDRRVLYNELITLYKIYFNRSIFDSIKNLMPARASVRTGVVLEPTILERPKYQHHPVYSEMNTGSVFYYDVTASHYAKDSITKLVRFSGSVGNTSRGKPELLFAEFNIDTHYSMSSFLTPSLPANLTTKMDISYINEANFNYPCNYGGGYITDLMDDLQFGNFGTLGGDFGYPEAIGVTTQEDLNIHPHPSGSSKFFLVKKWDKYTIFNKSGPYVRPSDKDADTHSSNSIWLYSLVAMTPEGYSNLFYTASKYELAGSTDVVATHQDYAVINSWGYYFHRANTAKKTNNKRINTIRGTLDTVSYPEATISSPYINIAENTYFEVFGGYPRNHYTHKRMLFSPIKTPQLGGEFGTLGKYPVVQWTRGRQTEATTVASGSGLNDGSLPVQEIQTSNVNLVQSDNVINQ